MSVYGIYTYLPGDKPVVTSESFGGVFKGMVTFSNTDPAASVRTRFPELIGRKLAAFVVSGGYHNWVQNVEADGTPYVEAIGYPIPTWSTFPDGAFNTVVGVFAL